MQRYAHHHHLMQCHHHRTNSQHLATTAPLLGMRLCPRSGFLLGCKRVVCQQQPQLAALGFRSTDKAAARNREMSQQKPILQLVPPRVRGLARLVGSKGLRRSRRPGCLPPRRNLGRDGYDKFNGRTRINCITYTYAIHDIMYSCRLSYSYATTPLVRSNPS